MCIARVVIWIHFNADDLSRVCSSQIGTVLEQVGDNLCVRLDVSARRLKVNIKNVTLIDPREPCATAGCPAAGGASSRGASSMGTAGASCGGSSSRSSNAGSEAQDAQHAAASASSHPAPTSQPTFQRGFLRPPHANDAAEMQAGESTRTSSRSGPQPAASETLETLLVSVFERPTLRSNYGLFLVLGCARLIAAALRRRGQELCGNEGYALLALIAQTYKY